MRPVGDVSLRGVLGMLRARSVGAVWPGLAFRTSFAVMRLRTRRLPPLGFATRLTRGFGAALSARLLLAGSAAAPAAAASPARSLARLLLGARFGGSRFLDLAFGHRRLVLRLTRFDSL